MSPRQPNKSKQYIGTREYVSEDTGEVIGKAGIFKTVFNEKERFVMIFVEEMGLYDILGALGKEGQVFGYILKNSQDNKFYFSEAAKDDMEEQLGIKRSTIRSIVSKFCKHNLIGRLRASEYMVNPAVFFTGKRTERHERRVFYEMNIKQP